MQIVGINIFQKIFPLDFLKDIYTYVFCNLKTHICMYYNL